MLTMWGILELNVHIARITKQPIVTINVLLGLISTVPLGLVYRNVLHPKRVSHSVRHLVGLLLGLWIGWVCIKREMFLLLAICLVFYILNNLIKPGLAHKVVFGLAMSGLLVAQIIRMIQTYGENNFDYTGRLMLLVQKYTFVACAFYDGMARDEKDLSEWQKDQRIKKFPSMLAYFGYLFHFSTFLVGPTCTFREYMDFIEGKDIERALENSKGHSREPSPVNCLKRKACIVAITIVGTAVFAPKFPLKRNGDPLFIAKTPFLQRCLYAWVSLIVCRLKYYTAFILGEMGAISSGMGFSGFDKDGNEMWENASMVNILSVEFPSSIKMVIDNWNISTAKWLKRTVNDRVPYQKAALTFTVSLLWHGIYPGYFMTAFTGFLILQVSRETRRAYLHVYQDLSSIGYNSLHALQIFSNVVILTFCTIPFPLLRFDWSIQYWRSMYYYGFILCTLALVFLRLTRKPKPKEKLSESPKQAVSSDTNKNGFANNNAAYLRKPHSNKGSL